MTKFGALIEIGGIVLVTFDNKACTGTYIKGRWKSTSTPPTKKDGSRPALRRRCDVNADVVVFPCVPAITMQCLLPIPNSAMASGIEMCGIPASRMACASGFTSRMTLPTTTRSGRGSKFSGLKTLLDVNSPLFELRTHGGIDMLITARDLVSKLDLTKPASDPIPVPQTPIK